MLGELSELPLTFGTLSAVSEVTLLSVLDNDFVQFVRHDYTTPYDVWEHKDWGTEFVHR